MRLAIVRLSKFVWIRRKPSKTPPFPPIFYPALAGLIGNFEDMFSEEADVDVKK